MSGKGDKRRPSEISQEELASKWERTFGPKREVKRKVKRKVGQIAEIPLPPFPVVAGRTAITIDQPMEWREVTRIDGEPRST